MTMAITGMTNEVYQKFENLCSRLSPENLSNDGELNQLQIHNKMMTIRSEWNDIEREIGRVVTHKEIEDEWAKHIRG